VGPSVQERCGGLCAKANHPSLCVSLCGIDLALRPASASSLTAAPPGSWLLHSEHPVPGHRCPPKPPNSEQPRPPSATKACPQDGLRLPRRRLFAQSSAIFCSFVSCGTLSDRPRHGAFSTMVVSVIAAVTSPIQGVISISEEIPAWQSPARSRDHRRHVGHCPCTRHRNDRRFVAATIATPFATGAALLFLGHFKARSADPLCPLSGTCGFPRRHGRLILQGGISVIAAMRFGLGLPPSPP